MRLGPLRVQRSPGDTAGWSRPSRNRPQSLLFFGSIALERSYQAIACQPYPDQQLLLSGPPNTRVIPPVPTKSVKNHFSPQRTGFAG
jgi:hypothetical protein